MKAVKLKSAMQTTDSNTQTDHSHDETANRNNTSEERRSLKFESEFSDWIAAQNNWVEKHDIPGVQLRPW